MVCMKASVERRHIGWGCAQDKEKCAMIREDWAGRSGDGARCGSKKLCSFVLWGSRDTFFTDKPQKRAPLPKNVTPRLSAVVLVAYAVGLLEILRDFP